MFNTLSPVQKGMILTFAGYTGFAWSDAAVKFLSEGYSLYQIITMVMGLSAVLTALFTRPWAQTERGPATAPSQNKYKTMGIHVLRGALNFLISILFLEALSKVPLTTAYTFIFTKPFFAVILSMALYAEHVPVVRWFAIIVGFTGVIIAMRPGTEGFDIVLLYPMLAAVCSALMFVVSKSLKDQTIFELGFYPAVLTGLLSLPLALPDFIWPSIADMSVFLISGTGITIGLVGVTLGYRSAPSAAVSGFHYTQIIWGVLFGTLLFNDWPDAWTMLGASIIIGSGAFLIWHEQRIKAS